MGNAQITSSSEYVTIKTGQTMPSPYNNVKEISKYYTENKNNNGQLINIDGTHIALGGKPIYYIIFYEPAGYWITKSYFPLSIEQTTKNSPIDEFRIYVDDNLKVTNIVKYSFTPLRIENAHWIDFRRFLYIWLFRENYSFITFVKIK